MTALHDAWQQLMAAGRGRDNFSQPEPPASEESIAEAQRQLKRTFPVALIEMLRCSRAWMWREAAYDAVIFHPPQDIVSETRRPADVDARIDVDESDSKRVKAICYSPKRLTFAFSDYFRFQIDEDTGPGGRSGQIVAIDTEEGTIDLVAESFEAFLAHGLACLKEQLLGGYPAENGTPADEADPLRAIAIPVISALPPSPSESTAPATPAKPLVKFKAGDALGAALGGIDAWLAANSPPDTKRFKKGLTLKQIRQYLSVEGEHLPEELFPLFMTVNGQSSTREALLPCPLHQSFGLQLHSLDDTCRSASNQIGSWELYKHMPDRRIYESSPGIKSGFWRKLWIPFASGPLDQPRERLHLFVDLDPAPDGVHGQVVLDFVTMDATRENGTRRVIAPSLTGYFEALLRDLESGQLHHVWKRGIVWRAS